MWTAIGQVTTGLSLAAFIVAVAMVGYQAHLRHKIKALEALPPADRIVAIERQLNSFGIAGANLTKSQQYNLAVSELVLRSRKLLSLAVVIIIITIVFGAVSIYSLSMRDTPVRRLSGYKLELNETKEAIMAAGRQVASNKEAQDLIYDALLFYENSGKQDIIDYYLKDLEREQNEMAEYKNNISDLIARRAQLEKLIFALEEKSGQ